MEELDIDIRKNVLKGLQELYNSDVPANSVQIQKTRKEFTGDVTLVVFPFLRYSKKSPDLTAAEIGGYLQEKSKVVSGYNVVNGFLNIIIHDDYWHEVLLQGKDFEKFLTRARTADKRTVMVEYSSPNTNKPLHLGHVRNILIGYSLSRIIEATGNDCVKVNLVNDRGIHICKSMLAWKKWGKGETPQSTGKKGDHLVGDYYVKFDQEYKKQIKSKIDEGLTEEEAKKQAPLILEAQEMLRKWEAGDQEVVELWEMMNQWVYDGFDKTYDALGVDFDKIYYESDTYKLGKLLVLEGEKKGLLYRREDGSLWADLTREGLDNKLLLRSDGTSVYITQDLGTAHQRFKEYQLDEHVYVVGNEQNYHFQVLVLILQKLGHGWAKNIKHLSYGMVELPEGKMKSREGTVVDADDLINEMTATARDMSLELGKLEGFSDEEKEEIFRIIGLGALKYFILKVDPKKNMVFNPAESIDFNGKTGPFIQYTYARIRSVFRNAEEKGIEYHLSGKTRDHQLNERERELIKTIHGYASIVREAYETSSPALIANYIFEMVKQYNQFYHDHSILHESNPVTLQFRMGLSELTGKIIKHAMYLLGIEVPVRM